MEQRRKRYIHVAQVKDLNTTINNTFGGLTVVPDDELIARLRGLENPRIEAIYNATNSTTYRIVYGPIEPGKQLVEYWQLFVPKLNIQRRNAPSLHHLSQFQKIDEELIETFDFERIVFGHKDVNGKAIAIE